MRVKNRIPWIVSGVVVVVLLIAVFAFGGKEESKPKPPPESARALSVPVNRARTVVVPPCNTPVEQTTRLAARGQAAPGATTLELPAGSGVRFVLVPHCQPATGVTATPGNIPSAAFVLAERERPAERQGGGFTAGGVTASNQLILPNGSAATTIVVPPCEKGKGSKRDVVLGEEKAGTVVAPSC